MKKLLILFLLALLGFQLNAIARKDTGPPEWTFDDPTELADWRDVHGLSPSSSIVKVKTADGLERSILKFTVTGDNPYVYPGGSVPNWDPFDGYEHKSIYIGVRVDKTDVWKVEYITARNEEFNEAKSRKFTINATRDFQDLKLEMGWEGLIRGFRIHFGTGKNRTIELDYLSLRGQVVTTQSPRKLATTWGKVKYLF